MPRCLVWSASHEEQRVSYTITPDGSVLSLKGFGAQLEAIATILESDASEHDAKALLAGITMTEAGVVTVDVVVAPKNKQAREPDHG